MKANEFVKKFGWTGFKMACQHRAINRYKYTIIWSDEIGFSNEINKIDADWTFESKNVLRLVASYELVQSQGGLEKTKNTLAKMRATNEFHKNSKVCGFSYTENSVNALEKAIADFESCL